MGDANIAFFHKAASHRRRRNALQGLCINGVWEEDPTTVKVEALRHFHKRFSADDKVRVNFPIQPINTLSDLDRSWLEREFSLDEIKAAVWDCGSDKAPGPDGFNFHMIKSLWSTIAPDIQQFVQEFHTHGRLVKGINTYFIILVPKKKNPLSLEDYRPISLISSLYKIISKCLANRMKSIMEKIISPTQSAFIGGRNIYESIMACNEMLHTMKKSRSGSFAFKVDFEKAFDCVN